MEEQEKYMLLASLTMQIQASPNDAELYLQRSQVYVAINDLSHALEDLDKAINLNPQMAKAYQLRGQLRFQLHDKASAFDDLQKAIQLDPNLLNTISGEYKTAGAKKPFKVNI